MDKATTNEALPPKTVTASRPGREKYLFLDVDGVLLPHGVDESTPCIQVSAEHPRFPLSTLAAFSKILAHPSVCLETNIILSSTWRSKVHTKQKLIDTLQAYGQEHGGGLKDFQDFHDTTDIKKHTVRKWEVVEYFLKTLGKGKEEVEKISWVALDDDKSFLRGKKYEDLVQGHCVMCDLQTGLTDELADQAITILSLSQDDQQPL